MQTASRAGGGVPRVPPARADLVRRPDRASRLLPRRPRRAAEVDGRPRLRRSGRAVPVPAGTGVEPGGLRDGAPAGGRARCARGLRRASPCRPRSCSSPSRCGAAALGGPVGEGSCTDSKSSPSRSSRTPCGAWRGPSPPMRRARAIAVAALARRCLLPAAPGQLAALVDRGGGRARALRGSAPSRRERRCRRSACAGVSRSPASRCSSE